MKQTVIVTNRIEKPALEKLESHFNVTFFTGSDDLNNPDFLNDLKIAKGLIGLFIEIDADFLDLAPNLKIVSTISVGYNHLDIKELTKRGIMATHTPDILNDTVADTMIALLLATARRIPELDRYVKNKEWTGLIPTELYGEDVHHKTLGIIGMGRIGHVIAQRANLGFDMPILYNSRTRKPEAEERFNAKHLELDDLLKQSDYIILITPLTEETEGMIGKREFDLMKDTAIFINGSRGATIVENDLIQALKDKKIKAAGLDVYNEEPVEVDNTLLKMNNVVTLPHIGSSTLATELAMSMHATEDAIRGITGQKPKSLINKETYKEK
ncbi:MAG TPA: D-glycerate dehydrogenase [Pseudogracilibacillus sp.]|nr:D-glycerate dehydrogenase [Pseudogracilibacillus sp.]